MELEGKFSKLTQLNHHITLVLVIIERLRSGVGEVEHLKVGAVGQRRQERFNQHTFWGETGRFTAQGQLGQVPKERRGPTDKKIVESKGGEVGYWITDGPWKLLAGMKRNVAKVEI